MNIIEILVPLFIFIIIFPFLNKVYEMFFIDRLFEPFGGIRGQIKAQNTIDAAKKQGVSISKEDEKWLKDRIINPTLKEGKINLIKDKSKIKAKRKLLKKITNEQLKTITNESKQNLIYYQKFSVSDVESIVTKVQINATSSTDKDLIEDTTKSRLISDNNQQRIDELEKNIDKFGKQNEARFVAVESMLESATADKGNIGEVQDNIDILRKDIDNNNKNLEDVRAIATMAPTTDYVNNKVGSVKEEIEELEKKYRLMRNEFKNFSS